MDVLEEYSSSYQGEVNRTWFYIAFQWNTRKCEINTPISTHMLDASSFQHHTRIARPIRNPMKRFQWKKYRIRAITMQMHEIKSRRLNILTRFVWVNGQRTRSVNPRGYTWHKTSCPVLVSSIAFSVVEVLGSKAERARASSTLHHPSARK